MSSSMFGLPYLYSIEWFSASSALPQPGWRACIPMLLEESSQLSRELQADIYVVPWKSLAKKPALLRRFGDGSQPAVLQALFVRERACIAVLLMADMGGLHSFGSFLKFSQTRNERYRRMDGPSTPLEPLRQAALLPMLAPQTRAHTEVCSL